MFQEALLVDLDVAIGLSLREFVGLGEDYTKGYSIYAKEFEEAKIDILWLKARIDKHEEEVHLLALQNVVGDELGELATGGLRHTCVAITWQVHQVPTIVDEEVVDKFCLTWCARHLSQSLHPCKHIHQRRLADVASSDEGDILEVVLGNLRDALGATLKFCLDGNCHSQYQYFYYYAKVVKRNLNGDNLG